MDVLRICFGNIFQEYNKMGLTTRSRRAKKLHFVWILGTTFLTMAFVGNLKSTLVRKSYHPRTQSAAEVVDKDMLLTMPNSMEMFLEMDQSESTINKRFLCQARKTNGVLKTE